LASTNQPFVTTGTRPGAALQAQPRKLPYGTPTRVWRGGWPAAGRLTRYNVAVQQTYLRLWSTTLGVGKELARGYFCAVTPP